MKRNLFIINGIAVIIYNALAEGISLPPMDFPSCGNLDGRIFCYGGVQNDTLVDSNLYFLNVTQFSGQLTDSIRDKWEMVKPKIHFDTEARINPTTTTSFDGKQFLVHGGHSKNGMQFVNQTIIYDITFNSWKNVSPFDGEGNGTKQIYSASAVSLQDNRIAFYGGIEQALLDKSNKRLNSNEILQNIKEESEEFSDIGFANLHFFFLDTQQWSISSTNAPEGYYPHSHTATLDPSSGKIYFFGGISYNFTDPETQPYELSSAYTFNTNDGSWLRENFGGKTPSQRMYHTANLLPNSRDIILYGGTANNENASADYCFTLNLLTQNWTEQTIVNVPSNLSGPRFDHSAVLVDTTLFILFGKGLNGSLVPSFLSIDVGNVANISYTSILNARLPPTNNTIPSVNNTVPSTTHSVANSASTGLSKGAVGGIAAGVSVGVLAIILAIICCIRRKKKSKDRSRVPNDYYHERSSEKIYVAGNKANDQYRYDPPISLNVTSSPQPTRSMGTTKLRTTSHEVAPTLRSHYVPNLANMVVMDDDDYSVDQPQGTNEHSRPQHS